MIEIFLATMIKLWIFSNLVEVESSQKVVPGAWQELSKTAQHCLMYRAPLKSMLSGELAIFKRKKDGLCLESISSKSLRQIEVDSRPILKLNNGQLSIAIEVEKQKVEKKFPLWGDVNPEVRDAYIGAVKNRSKFLDIGERCTDDCNLCPRGHSWLIGKEEIYKACIDPNECGASGEPACYLGSDWHKGASLCEDHGKNGWCEAGLKTRCSEETGFLECE
tara:strand:+ start:19751 stop:20410 length:660 start_codon:yes stop_codon:yes gene_type:complete